MPYFVIFLQLQKNLKHLEWDNFYSHVAHRIAGAGLHWKLSLII